MVVHGIIWDTWHCRIRLTSQTGTLLPAWPWTSPSEHMWPRAFPRIRGHRTATRRISTQGAAKSHYLASSDGGWATRLLVGVARWGTTVALPITPALGSVPVAGPSVKSQSHRTWEVENDRTICSISHFDNAHLAREPSTLMRRGVRLDRMLAGDYALLSKTACCCALWKENE